MDRGLLLIVIAVIVTGAWLAVQHIKDKID